MTKTTRSRKNEAVRVAKPVIVKRKPEPKKHCNKLFVEQKSPEIKETTTTTMVEKKVVFKRPHSPERSVFHVRVLRLSSDGSSSPAEEGELTKSDRGEVLKISFSRSQAIHIPIRGVVRVGDVNLTPLGYSLPVNINGSDGLKMVEFGANTNRLIHKIHNFISDVVEMKESITEFKVTVTLFTISSPEPSTMSATMSNDGGSYMKICLGNGRLVRLPFENMKLGKKPSAIRSISFWLNVNGMKDLTQMKISCANHEEVTRLFTFLREMKTRKRPDNEKSSS